MESYSHQDDAYTAIFQNTNTKRIRIEQLDVKNLNNLGINPEVTEGNFKQLADIDEIQIRIPLYNGMDDIVELNVTCPQCCAQTIVKQVVGIQ